MRSSKRVNRRATNRRVTEKKSAGNIDDDEDDGDGDEDDETTKRRSGREEVRKESGKAKPRLAVSQVAAQSEGQARRRRRVR